MGRTLHVWRNRSIHLAKRPPGLAYAGYTSLPSHSSSVRHSGCSTVQAPANSVTAWVTARTRRDSEEVDGSRASADFAVEEFRASAEAWIPTTS